MAAYQPTHEVINQVPPLKDYNAYLEDRPLREGVAREGGAWAEDRLTKLGGEVASGHFQELARLANKHTPELQTHDRFGNRTDTVEFHPAYHELLGHAIASGGALATVHPSAAGGTRGPRGHVLSLQPRRDRRLLPGLHGLRRHSGNAAAA